MAANNSLVSDFLGFENPKEAIMLSFKRLGIKYPGAESSNVRGICWRDHHFIHYAI